MFKQNNQKKIIIENKGVIKLIFIPLEKNFNEIEIEIQKKIPNNMDIIERLEKFLNGVFEEIDPEKEMKNLRIILQTLRENILGRKIRISSKIPSPIHLIKKYRLPKLVCNKKNKFILILKIIAGTDKRKNAKKNMHKSYSPNLSVKILNK